MAESPTRRDLLRLSTTGAVLAAFPGCARAEERPAVSARTATVTTTKANTGPIPLRPLGKTGATISIMGLGGYHLGVVRDDDDAMRIVHEALDAGVNFFDNAWEYNDGKSEEVLGRALVGRRDRAFVMTKVCTHGRSAEVAMQQLETSLRRLRTDHLDLWQIHECVYENDPDLHFAKGGVIEALDRAKSQGKVRFVGFTGHKSPLIHLKMLSHDYPFDTVQMPINVFDGQFRSFEQLVLPEAKRKQMGILGMKSLNGTGDAVQAGIITAEEGIRYAMSAGVTTTIMGVDSLDILRQNLNLARGFVPMSENELRALRDRVAGEAVDGRFELYKTSVHFDGGVGRHEHGYPPPNALPL